MAMYFTETKDERISVTKYLTKLRKLKNLILDLFLKFSQLKHILKITGNSDHLQMPS